MENSSTKYNNIAYWNIQLYLGFFVYFHNNKHISFNLEHLLSRKLDELAKQK